METQIKEIKKIIEAGEVKHTSIKTEINKELTFSSSEDTKGTFVNVKRTFVTFITEEKLK